MVSTVRSHNGHVAVVIRTACRCRARACNGPHHPILTGGEDPERRQYLPLYTSRDHAKVAVRNLVNALVNRGMAAG